jgi:hypothetical protein
VFVYDLEGNPVNALKGHTVRFHLQCPFCTGQCLHRLKASSDLCDRCLVLPAHHL